MRTSHDRSINCRHLITFLCLNAFGALKGVPFFKVLMIDVSYLSYPRWLLSYSCCYCYWRIFAHLRDAPLAVSEDKRRFDDEAAIKYISVCVCMYVCTICD